MIIAEEQLTEIAAGVFSEKDEAGTTTMIIRLSRMTTDATSTIIGMNNEVTVTTSRRESGFK